MASETIPTLPVPLAGLVKHIGEHPKMPMVEMLEPYRKYEAHLRQMYAQDPNNALLRDPYVNVLPLFTEDTGNVKIRARNLEVEPKEEKAKYIMPLSADVRRRDASPATVHSFKDFQRHFNVFSESSLVELDWSNVVAAGSSVVNCLLPVPEEYSVSKRGLRQFYHEKFCPASDVDLFLYGLTEERAVEKIKEIETRVRDALLTEVTVVRTKHAVTICSQYPTRHIQIVLRLYNSVSEILTGFDIDCSGAAYDGKQVYCTPRALQSYMTQINHIDMTRRSPSYENRLSKYSHRGFEVYWPDFDRSRVDPTIFERSFQRTLGLARLLVLERLPTSNARDQYLDKRREERGRPRIDRYNRYLRSLAGNIKEEHEDEVADWFTEEEVSNYHTFTIPYGPRFHAKRIEKLCYTRDLLLNAEWNQHEVGDRDVYLHRHPAFFGRFEDVIRDCCGYCPVPKTDEEKEVAEEDKMIYVSGNISFIKDDPGRQQIGSFNPLTDDDWTEMAYVGNTAQLCQAIVDEDLDQVQKWLAREDADPNTRDYTGRTPLHLAVMSSTPEVVQALVDAGARLVARLADGRTALHLAAARGDAAIVTILLDKSAANEEEHEEEYERKQEQRRLEKQEKKKAEGDEAVSDKASDDEESDGELIDDEESDDGIQSMATGSFVKVGQKEAEDLDNLLELKDREDEPDFYDINVIAWDRPCSALHFAIVEGHVEVAKLLVMEYGADVLLPVKFERPLGALLTLVLSLALPVEKAKEMTKALLSLGATSAQSDMNGVTPFHRFVEENATSLLETLWKEDPVGSKSAINHLAFRNSSNCETPLQLAVQKGNLALVLKLLDNGAVAHVDFENWLKAAKESANVESQLRTLEDNQKLYRRTMEQPLIQAINCPTPEIALELLERGADPNIITPWSQQCLQNSWYSRFNAESALDLVDKQLAALREYKEDATKTSTRPKLQEGIDTYLSNFEEGTYKHWTVSKAIKLAKHWHKAALKTFEKNNKAFKGEPVVDAIAAKTALIKKATETMEKIREALVAKGAKLFEELYPEFKDRLEDRNHRYNHQSYSTPKKDEPFTVTFSFRNVKDVTDARKEAYFKLFNAAYQGNLDTIKTLTLTSWDDAQKEAPLKVAVYDLNKQSPFSIAFTQGHYDVAKAVLEIAHAQYTPEEKPKARYRMTASEEHSEYNPDYDSDNESIQSGGSAPQIYRHIVDAQFTVDNVGEVSMKVKSQTTPLQMISWSDPFWSVIYKNDMPKLKFLLDVCERWSLQTTDPEDEASRFYAFPDTAFERAVELGRLELLGEIIKRTGAGLPLEDLVKNSGLELVVKPRYYQGLTVYGKKRNDWATAGREIASKPSGTQTSPLLLAAFGGRIESVEWFLSDTPLRQYLAFAKSKAAREDAKLKHLAQTPGGFDAAISKWLNDQSELVLHAAVYARPSKKATELLSYLIKSQPSLLEVKAADGATPLMLAYKLGRLDCAKLLLDAGADPATKDYAWNNLLHAALSHRPSAKEVKPMLDLLDREALTAMLKERNRLDEGGRNPLHQYCYTATTSYFNAASHYKTPNNLIRMFNLLVSISPQTAKHALRMLDGAGDTPLHTLLAKDTDTTVVRTIIEFDQSLLFCENAVGRTPTEVTHDRYIANIIKSTSWSLYRPDNSVSTLVNSTLSTQVDKVAPCDEPKEHEAKTTVAKNWRLCVETMARNGQPKRTLVSLNSANFVAKRLGEQHTKDRYKFQLEKKEDEGDEVSVVLSDAEGDADGATDVNLAAAPTTTTTTTGQKTKRRRADAITSRDYNLRLAYARPMKEKIKGEDGSDSDSDNSGSVSSDGGDSDAEDDIFPVCSKCNQRHC
ncbi:hypothetical protein N0V88_004688 [Collariella sp. IMI 366227]|nr:hypothetical protein N0V88_004688 [Collariella sp. IMI 366227]